MIVMYVVNILKSLVCDNLIVYRPLYLYSITKVVGLDFLTQRNCFVDCVDHKAAVHYLMWVEFHFQLKMFLSQFWILQSNPVSIH